MKIIVIGAGKIGFSIAELLSNEGHDVVVIDQDDERIELVDQTLDVQAVVGSGSSRKTLEAGGVGSADMVVAVTEMDELNMIACLLSKQYGARITVARVRNPEYVETSNSFIKELLGIDLILNPERVTAMEIADIIKNPELFNVDYYADGKVRMVEVLVEKDSPIAETKLKNLDTSRFVITAIMRNHRMFVPGGEDLIKVADHLYVMANATDIPEVLKIMGIQKKKIENITILGGGRTGYYLAKELEDAKVPVDVKLIEKDTKRAKDISEKLNCLVINGDGSDFDLLQSENIGLSDFFVAVTDDDKLNMLSALIAKNLGVKKTIARIKRTDVIPLMEQIGIDVVLSPRTLTAGAVLKYIRKGNILSVKLLGEEKAEMIELVAQPGSAAVNRKLHTIGFPRGAVVGAIVRGEEVIIPDGQSVIQAFDHLMIFSMPKSVHKVEKLFIGEGK